MDKIKNIKKVRMSVDKVLTAQDLTKFKTALQEKGYSQLIDLCTIILYTGVRINEALELKFTDVDYISNSILIGPMKNRSQQIRTGIMLNDECMEVLSRLQRKYPNDVFVFQSRNSKNQKNKLASPVSRQFVMKGFKTASDSISLSITTISLRRHYETHMSFMASSYKVDHKYLSQLSGHNTKNTIGGYINKELIASHKKSLKQSHKMDNEIEALFNAETSNYGRELSDIAKKHGVSESDLSITLKTIQKIKENT